VVSNGMLCSAAELKLSAESDGILELDDDLPVGATMAQALSLEPVIDFEVTPNRPDWLGVAGIARDLAAAGLGALKTAAVQAVPGVFPCPITVEIAAPEMCPVFAGRVIRGVRNGPSPAWLQDRLRAVGLRPINALVDVTNYVSYDRARPLHVYDVAKLAGGTVVARAGHAHEHLIALDGKTYALGPEMCVIADGEDGGKPDGARPIGLGGVMGGASTGCSDDTVDVFVESAWFDPLTTAQTGRTLGISSDAQYRFARGVDPGFVVPGLELATWLILDLCGGEPSEIVVAGEAPLDARTVVFDPGHVQRLSGLSLPHERIAGVLIALGFEVDASAPGAWRVQPPSWRRDVEGSADLVEEVARIAGYGALPSTPLPEVAYRSQGVLSPRQARVRAARRALAAMGYDEAVTWSFLRPEWAALFGGAAPSLTLENPIASDLAAMRPSILPNLIDAARRNAARGFADVALFEIGPVFVSDAPNGQMTSIAGLVAPHAARHWSGAGDDPLFALKADLFALLTELGAPVSSLQVVQGKAPEWWHPGRSASVQLGPKTTLAAFGALHPRVLKAMDADGPMLGFELILESVPEPKRKAAKAKGALSLSPLMPLTRDFAFVTERERPAGDLVRAAAGADKQRITAVRVFDVYEGAGVSEGSKSVALEVVIQPQDKTLTDAEIEQLSARVIAAVETLGARLRS
jgi:phenylalanyl-tRNA synthetase beta chain